ncbi:MAG TPA: hypothetical protein VEG30_17940 [Terriglobales bacterium]|nr:hypothetical protein [Terriglobales bacterium]
MRRISTTTAALLTTLVATVMIASLPAHAQNACPAGFNDRPALQTHIDQNDIVNGRYSFQQVFNLGRQIFITDFNRCDGAGRPANTAAVANHGIGGPRTPDPLKAPRLTILSGPDANSCASCHNEPEVGGAGSFHANLFDQAIDCDPVSGVMLTTSVFGNLNAARPCRPTTPTSTGGGFAHTFNERGSLGMFGSGAIELLGREMTDDLQNLKAQALAQAAALHHDVTVNLVTKGVQFGSLTAHSNGTVDTSQVQGVSPDLVIRPFGRKGQNKSIRHFTIQGFNRHLGIQPVEALEQLNPPVPDPDQDEISNELTVGDVTAVTVFEAALPVPRRTVPHSAQELREVLRGEQLFSQIGCASCHVPALPLRSTIYCEPNARNQEGDFRDTSQSFCFDLRKTSGLVGKWVPAFTDLKRHTICDPTHDFDPVTNHYCDDVPISQTPATDKTNAGPTGVTDRPPYYQFMTAKLWDTGNSGPWGHRNDLDTIYEAISRHGGEATQAETAFESLSDGDQLAVVSFLKTLQMPIMDNNPQPQEEGSPTAPNPGGGFTLLASERHSALGWATTIAVVFVFGVSVIWRGRKTQRKR